MIIIIILLISSSSCGWLLHILTLSRNRVEALGAESEGQRSDSEVRDQGQRSATEK